MKFKIAEHILVPKHERLSAKEKDDVLEKYNVTIKEIPQIRAKDTAIQHLNAKEGDMIKITRKSKTAGEAVYYRVVKHA